MPAVSPLRSHRPAELPSVRRRSPPSAPGVPFRPTPGYTPRSCGVATRCGCSQSNRPSLRPVRSRTWGLEDQGHRHWQNAEVHAYVARSDPNMGVRTGAKRSYFVDHIWELTRSAAASCNYTDGEFDKTGSLIHRDGTLNGIATAKDASVHVAGGYILANGRKSPYSSAGPARSGPPRRSGLRAALRRVLRARGHTGRRQQERRRVSSDGHQCRGTATGATRCRSADIPPPTNVPITPEETQTGWRQYRTAITRRPALNSPFFSICGALVSWAGPSLRGGAGEPKPRLGDDTLDLIEPQAGAGRSCDGLAPCPPPHRLMPRANSL